VPAHTVRLVHSDSKRGLSQMGMVLAAAVRMETGLSTGSVQSGVESDYGQRGCFIIVGSAAVASEE